MYLNGQTLRFSLRHDVDDVKEGAPATYECPADVLAALVADHELWDQDFEEVPRGQVPSDYMCAWYTISVTMDGVLQCEVPGFTFHHLAHEHGFVDEDNAPVSHEVQSSESIALAWAMLERGVSPKRT
jgi:hypothetical protein